MVRCSKGHENPDGQAFCGACGERLGSEPDAEEATTKPVSPASPVPPSTGPPVPQAAGPPPLSPPSPLARRGNGLALAALVLGIVGVVAGIIPLLFFIAWVLGVLAFVFGIVGRNNARQRGAGKGQATAGAILGVVAIVLGVVGIVIVNNVLTSTKKAVERATFPTSGGGVQTGSTASETTAPNSAKIYKVGDRVTYVDGSSIQVYSYEQPVPPPRFQNPDPGMEFGLIDVEFCAGTTRSVSYNDLGFKVQMPDNRQYEAALGTAARDPDLSSGDIPPGGGCKRGFVTLKVPIGQRPTFVLWNYPSSEQTRWAP